jgi:hypothetical protein
LVELGLKTMRYLYERDEAPNCRTSLVKCMARLPSPQISLRWLFAACLLSSSSAHAIEGRDAAFYCTPEAAGGLAYDDKLRKWHSANFHPERNFVLKLQFIQSKQEKIADWADPDTVNQFEVSVVEAGSNKKKNCRNMKDYQLPVPVWSDGWVRCEAALTEYRFNPANNRFLQIYLLGYIDGKDNNDNTPSINAGICTKIN